MVVITAKPAFFKCRSRNVDPDNLLYKPNQRDAKEKLRFSEFNEPDSGYLLCRKSARS